MFLLPSKDLSCESIKKRLRLKRVESRRIRVEELLASIRQYIRDDVCANWGSADIRNEVYSYLGAALSDDSDSDDVWLKRSDSD